MKRRPILFLLLLVLAGCNALDQGADAPALPPPTVPSLFAGRGPEAKTTAASAGEQPGPGAAAPAGEPAFVVYLDATKIVGEISPLVYGLSGAPAEVLADLRPTLNSWGGNPSTRYNWRLGNAWNAASDWNYQNTDYDYDMAERGIPAHENLMLQAKEVGAAVRLAAPTLGWVAKDTNPESCSFPLPDGSCGDGGGSNCRDPQETTDPELTSVASTSEDIQAWMREMAGAGLLPEFIAMDNEPELWGYTHYDVHPECTTYQEILDKFLEYATAVREVAPEAQITGPVTCCWEYYWHSPAGSRDEALHDDRPFLAWFLDQVRAHDEETGTRTLDVLDVHYYPEGLYNDNAEPDIAARRLRSTHSLWDYEYTDESWIGERIALIPRLQALIDAHYPGTRLGISEWNWGADETMNGALAAADVLGILGREEVYFAAYWRYPAPDSPAYQAFKLYTNYDGEGSRFIGDALAVYSDDIDRVTGYGALDEAGTLRVMLIHKQPDAEMPLRVIAGNYAANGQATRYTLTEAGLSQDSVTAQEGRITLTLPPYSVTLLVFPGAGATMP